ncbi:protein-disulfide reductase DsbD [Ralstonia pseudosolanacearum]|uniref:protein-disulfide reductase DsbD n=1 Tax=Ralstonia pseudosolanacearum TaxID=1310165 RepID=UPI003CE70345
MRNPLFPAPILRRVGWALLALTPMLSHATPSDDALASAMATSQQPAGQVISPEQAFVSSMSQDGKYVTIRFKIADGYYLYRDRMHFKSDPPHQVGKPEFTPGEEKSDQFFGRQTVFKHDASVILPLSEEAPRHFTLQASFQGCAEAGVCYPPQTKVFEVRGAGPAEPPSGRTALAKAHPKSSSQVPVSKPLAFPTQAPVSNRPAPTVATEAPLAKPVAPLEQQVSAAGETPISRTSVGTTILTYFFAGIALAFTACMYPLLPIVSTLIAGQGAKLSRRRGFLLAMTYVQGLALTYTAVGVFAGMTGAMINIWLQQPVVILSASLMMIMFAMAMFDVIAIQLPGSLQAKLSQASNTLPGGRYASVFAMGALSALIVGPCVAPPLALALGYIGSTGDALLGGAALYAMALGLGLPLLAIGTFGGQFLPRAGGWMKTVKSIVGVGMLALAIDTASPFLPSWVAMLGWAALGVGLSVFLKAFDPLGLHPTAWQRLGKVLGLLLFIFGSAQLVGTLAGSDNPREPLRGIFRGAETGLNEPIRFKPVRTPEELDAALHNNRGRPIVLDISADWCVACKELEAQTFADASVANKLRGMTLLRVDVTSNSGTDQEMLKRFGMYGPPGVILFGSNGEEHGRVIGFTPPSAFLRKLEGLRT